MPDVMCVPFVPELTRLRQVDLWVCVSLGYIFFNAKNGVMSLISTLRRQREVDLCDIETRLV